MAYGKVDNSFSKREDQDAEENQGFINELSVGSSIHRQVPTHYPSQKAVRVFLIPSHSLVLFVCVFVCFLLCLGDFVLFTTLLRCQNHT